MRPSRFSESEIRQAISQVSAGTPLVAMCRKLGITPTTFYRWRRQYGAGGATGARETRALREENLKLKQLVADLYIERQSMRGPLKTNPKRSAQARD